jgi:hypothetical protein
VRYDSRIQRPIATVRSMPGSESGSRLVDQYRAASGACRLIVAATLEEVGMFADLIWSSVGLDMLLKHPMVDPAFTVVGNSRWLVFHRINDEIRYYASPLSAYGDIAKDAKHDRARLAAITTEIDCSERGVVPTVDDAVSLTDAYLSGQPLADIKVKRRVRSRSTPTLKPPKA